MSQFEFLVMTKIFLLINFLPLNISDFIFFYVKILPQPHSPHPLPLEKLHPPPTPFPSNPPLKAGPAKPPFLEIWFFPFGAGL